MAKHRRMSEGSRRTRTVIGGLAAGGALAAFAPAGMAAALGPQPGEVEANNPSRAVGRPDPGKTNNPAPVLRVVQQVGDSVFNQTGFNKVLDDSPIGTGYHTVFGTQGDMRLDPDDGKWYYKDGTGSEGLYEGVLNTAPGNVVGDAIPLRECQLVRDSASRAPVVSIRAQGSC